MNSGQLIKPRLKVTALCFGKTLLNTGPTRLFRPERRLAIAANCSKLHGKSGYFYGGDNSSKNRDYSG